MPTGIKLQCGDRRVATDYRSFTEEDAPFEPLLGLLANLGPPLPSIAPATMVNGCVDRLGLEASATWFAADRYVVFMQTARDIATCMYYTGIDPFTKQEVYIARTLRDRKLQRALMQFF